MGGSPIPKRRKAAKKARRLRSVAVDTETTGVYLHHGCKPFFVSACDDEGNILYWEWDVDPETREPAIKRTELEEIREVLETYDEIVFHNAKFDIRALEKAGLWPDGIPDWFWERVQDTHLASHALHSSRSHKLKDLAVIYLGLDDDDQEALREAVNEARRYGRKQGWAIASPEAGFPSPNAPRDGWYVMDFWLPRAAAKHGKFEPEHPWHTVLARYAITDAERTIGLWLIFRRELKREGLWRVYRERCRLLRPVYEMERAGVTFLMDRAETKLEEWREAAVGAERACFRLSGGAVDNIRSHKQLMGYFSSIGVETDTTQATRLKEILETLPRKSKPASFIRHLLKARRYEKGCDYLESYINAALKSPEGDWRLYPSFNIAGTHTTRFSSNSPNGQNISKQDDINLRDVFGPAPGREWYAVDYSNIELRIFAYASGDRDLIEAFERGEKVHLIFARLLWPEEYRRCEAEGVAFDEKYKTTLYQWTKNGNFALIYGAGERRADQAYHKKGAYRLIRQRMPLIDDFMERVYREAKAKGYIETLGGYRLEVPAEKPHAAVNYLIQGTAGWCLVLAMNRCYDYLSKLPGDYRIALTVHDELVFDFPARRGNEKVIRRVCRIMESCGDIIGVPTPVDCERITETWAKGEPIDED